MALASLWRRDGEPSLWRGQARCSNRSSCAASVRAWCLQPEASAHAPTRATSSGYRRSRAGAGIRSLGQCS